MTRERLVNVTVEFVKTYPHLLTVGTVFVVLYAIDYITFTYFTSLGFFSLLLADHLYDNLQEKLKARKATREAAANPPPQKPNTAA